MNHVNYSYLRNNLAKVLKEVNNDHLPMLVAKNKRKAAIFIPSDDFNAYEETAYLMKSSKNANHLNQAIKKIEANIKIKNDLLKK